MPVPPVVPCNAYGVAVAIFSLSACWYFARHEQVKAWDRSAATATLAATALSAAIVAYAWWGGAAGVGVLGMAVGIIMPPGPRVERWVARYAAPLSSMQEVLRTKSSESPGRMGLSGQQSSIASILRTLPVMQSFLGFLNSP